MFRMRTGSQTLALPISVASSSCSLDNVGFMWLHQAEPLWNELSKKHQALYIHGPYIYIMYILHQTLTNCFINAIDQTTHILCTR